MRRILLAAALVPALCAAQERISADTKIVWPAAQMRWELMPGLPGAMQARLGGENPARTEHGILYRWKAGTDVPVHTHTNGDRGVIVSGVLTLALEGGKPVELAAGSFLSIAGGVKHATGCLPGADCVFFVRREGPFDALMAQ